MADPCPECGQALQLLAGRDGHAVVSAALVDERGRGLTGRVVEQRSIANVYACSRCEFMRVGQFTNPTNPTATGE